MSREVRDEERVAEGPKVHRSFGGRGRAGKLHRRAVEESGPFPWLLNWEDCCVSILEGGLESQMLL